MRQAPAVRARSSTELKMSLFGLGVPELAVIGVLAVGQMIYPQISFNMHIYKMDLAMRLCVYLSLSVSIYLICNYLLIYPSTTHLFSSLSLFLPPSHAPSFGFLCLSSHTHTLSIFLTLSSSLFLSVPLDRSLLRSCVHTPFLSHARVISFSFFLFFPLPLDRSTFLSLFLSLFLYISTRTHIQAYTHSQSLSRSLTLKNTYTHKQAHTHTNTHNLAHTHMKIFSRKYNHTLAHTRTHTHTHTHILKFSLFQTHFHAHKRTHLHKHSNTSTLSHSLTYTHSDTHTSTYPHAHTNTRIHTNTNSKFLFFL